MADPLTHEERDALAAELALGLLESEARAQALRLKLVDTEFAALVDAWSTRIEPLGAGYAEIPPPDAWAGIERRLTLQANVVLRLRAWRSTAIGSAALAASLAAVLILRPLPAPVEVVRPPAQVVVAQLDGGEKGALFAAHYDPTAGELRIRAMRMPQSKLAPELWVIPADGFPRSLGLVSPYGTSRMAVPIPRRKLMREGTLLAVTMEPRDGAPHLKPSSARIAAGKISII